MLDVDYIKSMLDSGQSISNILKILKISKNKFYKTMKENSIDTKFYVDKRRFNPDLNELKHLIDQGYLNSSELGTHYGVSKGTIENFCNKHNITILNNRRRNKLFIPESDLISMIENGNTYDKIAAEYNSTPSTIKTYIKRHNLKIKKRHKSRIKYNNDIIEFIKELILMNIANRDIAALLNINRETLLRIMKENNLNNSDSHSIISVSYKKLFKSAYINHCPSELDELFFDHHKFIIDKAIRIRNIIADLNKDLEFKEILTPDEQYYIRNNFNSMAIYKISQQLNRCTEVINSFCVRNGIFPSFTKNYIQPPQTEEFMNDIFDKKMSISDISYKYNVSNTVAGRWREELAGKGFRFINDTVYRMSIPERKCAEILNKLDYTYFYEYIIDGYRLDFYLGQKKIIEVQGDYWHSLEKTKKSDADKNNYFTGKEYKLLYLYEHDINNNIVKVENDIKTFIVN